MFDPFAVGLLREALTQLLRGHSGAEADQLLSRVGDHWRGKPPRTWVSHSFKDARPAVLDDMPESPMSRTTLREFLATTADPQRALAAILAWGGMSYQNADGLVQTWSRWAETFEALRGAPADQQYERYRAETVGGALKGIGPAFFTKAIFFTAPPESPGFIMDQWTARSANVLLNDPGFVILAKGVGQIGADGVKRPKDFSVSPRNTVKHYAAFNAFVIRLSEALGCAPEQAELLMFSKATWWRAYVASRNNETRPPPSGVR